MTDRFPSRTGGPSNSPRLSSGRVVNDFLVPKLYLGTQLSAQLRCPPLGQRRLPTELILPHVCSRQAQDDGSLPLSDRRAKQLASPIFRPRGKRFPRSQTLFGNAIVCATPLPAAGSAAATYRTDPAARVFET